MENIQDQSGDSAAEQDEDVGYQNPPRHTRWPKGYCPNPRGRPARARGRRGILERIANELCTVEIGGRLEQLTRLEIVLIAVRNATANGNPAALKLFDWLLGQSNEEGPPSPKAVLICGEKLTLDEWEAEFGHLGGVKPPPPPGSIQMADCPLLKKAQPATAEKPEEI